MLKKKISGIESKIFLELRDFILGFSDDIQKNASIIATLDALISFAEVSELYYYTKPEINDSEVIEIVEGRHPVI